MDVNGNPSHGWLSQFILLNDIPWFEEFLNQLQKVLLLRDYMGWWPFSKKESPKRVVEPITKDGRTWLLELRDMCERNFDNPEEAKRRIRQMQVEWQECLDNGSLSLVNKEATG